MKFVLPLTLTAAPAFAHNGAHLHPHGTESWVYGAACVGLCLVIAAGRKLAAKHAEPQA